MGERLGNQHPPLHTAGEGHQAVVPFIPQRERLEHFFDMGGVGGLTKQATAEAHRIPDRFERFIGKFLRHKANPLAGLAVIAHAVEAIDNDMAFAGIDQATARAT